MKRILVLNGPNLNLLGIREPAVYGKETYAELVKQIRQHAAARGCEVEVFQSNHEGALVDRIQKAYGAFDGIAINPAAYTHTSVAILDALKAVAIPFVEVHLTDIDAREPFRKVSYVASAAAHRVVGRGFAGYLEAIDFLLSP